MMKCAVSDHLLVDGVLVEDKYVVSFIRKRVAEFRTMEEICRKCKEEITKIYREKQKRARALQKASLHDSSLSSLSASTSSSHDRMQKSLEEENAPILGNVSKNANFSKQPTTSKDATSGVFTLSSNVTTRKRNNPDYLKGKSADTNSSKRICHDAERPTTSKAAAAAASTKTQKRARALQKASLHDSSLSSLSASTSSSHDRMQKSLEEENAPILGNVSKNANFSKQPTTSKDATSGVFTLSSNVTTRKRNNPDYLKGKSADTNSSKRISHDSERPTTSKAAAAAASTESPITDVIIDSEDDEPRYSLNAFNGTRLPNVQPILPKRKPRTDLSRAELALIEYARDITGG